jgi:transcription factor C subunit 6
VALDVPYNVAAGPYSGGVLASEHDNSIKIFSLMPDMYGRGHTTTEANGPIWVGFHLCFRCFIIDGSLLTKDIATSDYHPYIATASSDGTCCTSNLMKPSRRGGVVVGNGLAFSLLITID